MGIGTVYLVGAGPGDPGLITLRGAECLRRADVVIYDRLVHPDLLRFARPDAERIYAGKESSRHTLTQAEINSRLTKSAMAGKIVCRLKGGDPFVFGRGGEEAEACAAAGVPFEIVPGVTSAIAAPAYAGIPITHRDAASSFAVITGHQRDDSPELGERAAGSAEGRRNWSTIANAADTLVFLMGIENLEEITARLVEHGRDPGTAIALIRWGTWPKQETLVSTLANVVEEARRDRIKPPAVAIVGEVVRMRATLRWFDTKPLFGKRILVTRAREQASVLSDQLREQGAEPIEFPAIKIAPLADCTELDRALFKLESSFVDGFEWVVFTSANGVRAVSLRLEAMRKDARMFGGSQVAAIGPATAESLRGIGIRADFVPSQFVAESVADEWPDDNMAGKRVLIPRAKEARELLPDRLREMGAEVEVVAAYETTTDAEAADSIREELALGSIQVVTFTSSSTVRNFVDGVGADNLQGLIKNTVVAAIGPITAQSARDFGLPPQIEAKEHTIPGLVRALVEYFQ